MMWVFIDEMLVSQEAIMSLNYSFHFMHRATYILPQIAKNI